MILFYFKIDGTKIELAGLTTLNKMISEATQPVYLVLPLFYQLGGTFNYKTNKKLLNLTFELEIWNMLGDYFPIQ